MTMPAMTGEKICAMPRASSVAPAARPSCAGGTSIVVNDENAGHWNALSVDIAAEARPICHNGASPLRRHQARASGASDDRMSVAMSVLRLSHRSVNAPANGESNAIGAKAVNSISVKAVTEPVSW